MSKNTIYGIAGAIVLGLIALFGFSHSSSPTPSSNPSDKTLGSTTEINPYQFTSGLGWGPITVLNSTAQVVIPLGQNQGSWTPPVSRDVIVDSIDVSINGTASSTFKVWVGTTTTATSSDQFNLTTAPFWSQLIDGFQVATGTGLQTGETGALLTDNINSHKSSYPGKLEIVPGQNLHVQFNTFCTAIGACETATSTNRGFTNMTATLWYHYKDTP